MEVTWKELEDDGWVGVGEQVKHNGNRVDSAWSAVVASRDHRLLLAQVHVTHEPRGEWPL